VTRATIISILNRLCCLLPNTFFKVIIILNCHSYFLYSNLSYSYPALLAMLQLLCILLPFFTFVRSPNGLRTFVRSPNGLRTFVRSPSALLQHCCSIASNAG
jgi:hypothetical protein